MSSWSNKLETRLAALTDSASKESLQTLAKWMGFNRKHASSLSSALAEAISKAEPQRKKVYLSLVNEVLMLDMGDPKKWDRLADLRTTLGEVVLLQSAGAIRGDERLDSFVSQWAEHNVLGGPTLLAQIRRALAKPSTTNESQPPSEPSPAEPTEVATTTTEPIKEEGIVREDTPPVATSDTVESKGVDQAEKPKIEESKQESAKTETMAEAGVGSPPKKEEAEETPKKDEAAPAKQSTPKAVKFDFEKEDIPFGKVEPREFLEPCRAIATLQIARELRSDTALQLSSLLSSIPESVMKVCEAAKEQQDKTEEEPEVSEDQLNEISKHFGDEVLDLDLDEMLQNIETFREIVEKQSAARERLIYLLIRSRCKFGSAEAAEAFYKLDDTEDLLQKRKELLLDAMALEGLDFEEEKTKEAEKEEPEKELEPLAWYEPSEPDAKRARHQ